MPRRVITASARLTGSHWGKPFGLTSQDLLDPSINIFLTCHVYKYFGSDFGRYHRGNGIKSEAYIVNVASILSTLNAYSKLNQITRSSLLSGTGSLFRIVYKDGSSPI